MSKSLLPKVAVQILTYGNSETEREIVQKLFGSLCAVTYPKDSWCLVIIDNPSPRGNMREHLRSVWLPESEKRLPKVFVIEREENNGFAGGHMTGLETSQAWDADFLYLLNQDTVVDSDFLSRVVEYASAYPNVAVAQSRLMLEQDRVRLNSEGNALHYLGFSFSIGSHEVYRPHRTPSLPVFCASGAAALVRMSVIDRIGLFTPEYFLYHEDVDLSWRARIAGYDIAVVEDSVVYHHYEFLRSISKVYLMERNRHLTNLINYEWKTLVSIAPVAFVMEIGTFFFALRSGWWRQKIRSWWFFTLPSTWAWIRTSRRRVAAFRKVQDADLLPFMCGVVTNQNIANPLLDRVVNPVTAFYLRFLQRLFVSKKV